MGALITRAHRDRVLSLVEAGLGSGASLVVDGRGVRVPEAPGGFFMGATVVEDVRPEMALAREEIFGPVLNVMHTGDLEAAIAEANKSSYGNGASIFTRSGRAAREFKHRINAGMIGINIGVPASLAMFPFCGWNDSFFGDLHIQGGEGVLVLHPAEGHHHPLDCRRCRRRLAQVKGAPSPPAPRLSPFLHP